MSSDRPASPLPDRTAPICRRSASAGQRDSADGRAVGGAGAADRGVSAEGQDAAARPTADGGGDHLAARERREVAGRAGRARAVVAGRAALHPLGQARRVAAAARSRAGAGRRARHGIPRRDLDQGAPQGRGCAQKGGTSRQRDRREALGRSRGGFGTKACVVADGQGRAVAFALAPGQAHELPLAPELLDRLPRVPRWVVGDRGYSSGAFRELIWSSGARPAIPTRSNEAAVACPDFIYNNRNLVERLWGRLKEWRAVATRYEKTAASFLGVLCLAATADWLKP
jgi:transposase